MLLAAHGDLLLALDVVRQLAHPGPDLLGRGADGLADDVELRDLALAAAGLFLVLEESARIQGAGDELREDHAHGPDVDGAAVVSGAVEELGGPVPDRDDLAGHVGVGTGEGAREAEVGELDLAVGGDEEVVGLDVAVQDEVLVAEVDGPPHHAHPGFDVGRAVGDAVFGRDEDFEVAAGEEFDHHVDVLVFGGEDVVERDDGGVRELAQVLDLADGAHVDAFFLLSGLDFELLDGK